MTSPTSVTVDPCRNSTDPACGDFYWDPPIVDAPLDVTITADKTDVPLGGSVTFTAVLRDADAIPRDECVEWFAEGESTPGGQQLSGPYSQDCVDLPPCTTPPPRYGAWDPPPPGPGGERTVTFTTTNSQDAGHGTFRFFIRAFSGQAWCSPARGAARNEDDSGLYADVGEASIYITFESS